MDKGKKANELSEPIENQQLTANPPVQDLAPTESSVPAPASPYEMMLEPVKKKKPWTKKRVIGLVAAALAVLLVGWVIVQALQGPPPTTVQTQGVTRGEVKQALATTGNLTTAEKISIFSPVTAPLNKVNVKQGSTVKAGDVMFTYDVKALERAYRTASASSASAYEQARQANAAAQKNVEEWQESVNSLEVQVEQQKSIVSGLVTAHAAAEATGIPADIATAVAALEGAKAQLTVLQQQLDASRKALESAKTSQDDTKKNGSYAQVPAYVGAQNAWDDLEAARKGVVAPISGIVTSMTMVQGALAAQYSMLCTIESLDKVDVVVALSRYDLERVEVGQKAVIKTLEHEYEATVTKIDGMATQSATASYVAATVSITKPDSKIRLGLEANVSIETGVSKNALWVPLSAVNTDVDGSYCFIVVDGFAERKEITIGLSNDTQAEIASGLAEGDRVILYSQNILPGAEVTDMGEPGGDQPKDNGVIIKVGNRTKKGRAA